MSSLVLPSLVYIYTNFFTGIYNMLLYKQNPLYHPYMVSPYILVCLLVQYGNILRNAYFFFVKEILKINIDRVDFCIFLDPEFIWNIVLHFI